jgi:vitamin B12 transporter
MDAYTLVNLAGSYKITEDITMFVQLDNIFDENYYSSAPYEAPGFCAFVELKITFPFK